MRLTTNMHGAIVDGDGDGDGDGDDNDTIRYDTMSGARRKR